jgi:hippurate hydrolase
VIAAQMVTAWQTLVSRNVNAQDLAVFSACSINSGDSWNVIPDNAVIKGTMRTATPQVQALMEARFQTLTAHIAKAFGAKVEINFRLLTPSCLNDVEQTRLVWDVAAEVLGEERTLKQLPQDTGGEDFGYMLQERPGCYFIIGGAKLPESGDPLKGKNINDMSEEDFCYNGSGQLHQPDYDFNDDLIPIGATMFVRLAETYLR